MRTIFWNVDTQYDFMRNDESFKGALPVPNAKETQVGNLSIEQVVKLAKMKASHLGSYKLKAQVSEIIGSCNSLGVTVEGKKAKEAIKDLQQGKFDSKIQ